MWSHTRFAVRVSLFEKSYGRLNAQRLTQGLTLVSIVSLPSLQAPPRYCEEEDSKEVESEGERKREFCAGNSCIERVKDNALDEGEDEERSAEDGADVVEVGVGELLVELSNMEEGRF